MIKYDKFATDYHNKRRRPWRDFEKYFDKLEKKGLTAAGTIIDLGCANGRHFELFKNSRNRLIGIDKSIEFLRIAQNTLSNKEISTHELNKIQLLLADMNYLPLRPSNHIDGIFSIAAVHHIKTQAKRNQFIVQVFNILKEQGFFIFTLWRRWQKRFFIHFIKDWIKRKLSARYRKKQTQKGLLEFGDNFVSWTLSSEDMTINRFYHLFSLREALNLLQPLFHIKNIEKTGGPTKSDNLFIYSKKGKKL